MKSGNRTGVYTALVIALAALQGCTAISRPRAVPDDPAYAPVKARAMMQNDPHSGAIYQTTRNVSLYDDTIALNVGDLLLVTLEERTQASKNAESEISKEAGIDVDEGNLFGLDGLNLGSSLNVERDFEGAAEADQSNSLAGSITVTVTDVYPNGILQIRGEKWVSLTSGDEYIRLTGLVRPQDITPDNTVSSNRIADARIAYGGTGDFDQANRMGWLSRFFNSEWFPL
jgi:flagellar L-ring protein precursor FlgH